MTVAIRYSREMPSVVEDDWWRVSVAQALSTDELIVFRADVRACLYDSPPRIAPIETQARMQRVAGLLLALACEHCLRREAFGKPYRGGLRSVQEIAFLRDHSDLWQVVQDTLDGFLKSINGSVPRTATALALAGDDLDVFLDELRVQALQACHRSMDNAWLRRRLRRTVHSDEIEGVSDEGDGRNLAARPIIRSKDPTRSSGSSSRKVRLNERAPRGNLHEILHNLLLVKSLPWQREKLGTILDAPSNASLKFTVLLGDAYRSGAHPRRALEAFESLALGAGGARVAELLDRIDAQARGDAHDPRRFGHLLQPHVFAILRELGLQFPHNDDSARKAMSRLQQELIATLRRMPEFLGGPDEDEHKDK